MSIGALDKETLDKVREVFRVLGIGDPEKANRASIEIALGYLMSIRGTESKHAVTKEIRRALEYLLKSSDKQTALKEIPYLDQPFESKVLNAVYSSLISRLARLFYEQTESMTPLMKRRTLNMIMDVIFNAAISPEALQVRNRIFEVLKG